MKYANKMMLVPYAQTQSIDNQMNQIVNSKMKPDQKVKNYNELLSNYLSTNVKKNLDLPSTDGQSTSLLSRNNNRQPFKSSQEKLLQNLIRKLLKHQDTIRKNRKKPKKLVNSQINLPKMSNNLTENKSDLSKKLVFHTHPATENVQKNDQISDAESENIENYDQKQDENDKKCSKIESQTCF